MGKKFGVGYVKDLLSFEEKVEKDLSEAAENNFELVVEKDLSVYEIENRMHQKAIDDKASEFVGRDDLRKQIVKHCFPEEEGENVMIIHGAPGSGKSGVLAAAARECDDKANEDHIIFKHVVDSCPGSAKLENMLRRLHHNLIKFRRDSGESDMPLEPPATFSDLKAEHHNFMNETGRKYPKKKIIGFYDGMNGVLPEEQAHSMWWLPNDECPKNIIFILSTLEDENDTYKNACRIRPQAIRLPVGAMSDIDLKQMVTMILEKYNKKLTTNDDDKFLGDQTSLLLGRNKERSPLYFKAACEALRQYGIYESLTKYIKLLPNDVPQLFDFLLDQWSKDHGVQLIEDVASYICLSPNGILENEINAALDFREDEWRRADGNNNIGQDLYTSSFSRLFDPMQSFLSAGGGGYMRFFHDQLKVAVTTKFLSTVTKRKEVHMHLVNFFYSAISSQLSQNPTSEPPDYYEHALQEVVPHQIKAGDDTEKTLRNLYFIRESILKGFLQSLIQNYMERIVHSTDNDEKAALKQWIKFVRLYAKRITEFPDFALSMALSQSPSNAVYTDSLALKEAAEISAPLPSARYPLFWQNVPQSDDAMLVKYDIIGGTDCAASVGDQGVCCAAEGTRATIFYKNTGQVKHRLKAPIFSLDLTTDSSKLYTGDKKGVFSVWKVNTGSLIQSTQIPKLPRDEEPQGGEKDEVKEEIHHFYAFR